nr:thermonuclease family protein [Mycoplasmopsis canis]WQQ12430.1 thermonuclease family protein [Mycoplasmopsis canis]
MKFKNKLFICGAISSIPIMSLAISCSGGASTKTQNKEKILENFKISSFVEKNKDNSLLSINISDSNIVKNDDDTYGMWTKGIKSDSSKKEKFNKVISYVIDLINDYINNSYLKGVKLPSKNGNQIFVDTKKISGAPESIKIKLNNKEVDLKLSNYNKTIEYGKLGETGQDKAAQDAAQEIKNILVSYSLSYTPLYKGKKLLGFENINIQKKEEVILNPLLKDLTINSNEANFKPTNISFNKPEINNSSFKARIESVSDGDTFSIIALESKTLKGGITIEKDRVYKVRLSGIDTPEKGVGSGSKYVPASPFEYSFAIHATNFAKQVIGSEKFKDNVMVGFVSGKDSYDRITADVFFGENYQYSYISEIVRSGHTLPYSNDIWKLKLQEKDTSSYEYNLYPFIAEAFEEAIKNNKGLFNYFDYPGDVSSFVYLIKSNNKWNPFYWERTSADEIISDYIKK